MQFTVHICSEKSAYSFHMTEKQLTSPSTRNTPSDYPIYWILIGILTGIGTALLGLFVHLLAGITFVTCVVMTISVVIFDYPVSTTQIGRWSKQHHIAISRVLGLICLLLFTFSALFYAIGQNDRLYIATPLMLVGSLLLGIALVANWTHYIEDRRANPARLIISNRPQRRIFWLPTLSGLSLLLVSAEINGNVFDPTFLSHINSNDQFIILIMGMLLLAWGIAGRRITPADEKRLTIRERIAQIVWTDVLVVVTILCLAFAVRWWQLGGAVRLFVDEVHFSNPVMHFYADSEIELLHPFSSVAAFPYIYPYMQYYAVLNFGRTLEGLRVVSVLFGVLNVGVIYLLAKEMFNKPIAILAMLFLAIFPPHIQFSRIGLNNIADPVFGTLAMYFLLRGIKPNRDMRLNFAWAGLMLGLTQYFYEGGRLLYPALAFIWLGYMGLSSYVLISLRAVSAYISDKESSKARALKRIKHANLKYHTQSMMALLGVFMLISLPIYYTLVGLNKPVISRMETAGVSERVTDNFTDVASVVIHITNRFTEAFLIHVAIPDDSLYYAGETALILSFVVPLFLLGLYYIFWRLDRPASSIILIWILLTWLGNTMMQQSRISARYVVEFPALALIVAIGLYYTGKLLFPLHPRTRNRLLTAVASMFIVFHITYFFGPHLAIFNEQFRDDINRDRDTDDVLFRSVGFPDGTQIYVVGEPVMPQRLARNLLNYLADDLVIYTLEPEEFTGEYLYGLNQTQPQAFYIEPDDTISLRLIRHYFPKVAGPFFSDYDIPMDEQYALYHHEGFFTSFTGSFPTEETD